MTLESSGTLLLEAYLRPTLHVAPPSRQVGPSPQLEWEGKVSLADECCVSHSNTLGQGDPDRSKREGRPKDPDRKGFLHQNLESTRTN